SSRIGTDNQGQLENLAKIWLRPEIRESYPCLVLAPQFSERSSSYAMSDQGYLVSSPSKDVAVLSELIDQILKQHPEADRDRVYLIGYSMGGSTVQNLLRYCGDKVAAIISIAAVPDLAVIADLKKMPVWLIHGKKDIENPFVGSEKLFGLLTGNKQLRFTEFTSLDHGNILIPLLLDDRLPNWLFSQRK
ncbi:MAG: alpha/beta fold hydrolase, partial [Pedobacter sp.]